MDRTVAGGGGAVGDHSAIRSFDEGSDDDDESDEQVPQGQAGSCADPDLPAAAAAGAFGK